MKALAIILLIIGASRLCIALSSNPDKIDIKVIDKIDTPVKIDPGLILFINGMIGVIEMLCSLYIIFK